LEFVKNTEENIKKNEILGNEFSEEDFRKKEFYQNNFMSKNDNFENLPVNFLRKEDGFDKLQQRKDVIYDNVQFGKDDYFQREKDYTRDDWSGGEYKKQEYSENYSKKYYDRKYDYYESRPSFRRYDDRYNDRYNERYEEDRHYNDRYNKPTYNRYDNRYDDKPIYNRYDNRYDERYDERYNERYDQKFYEKEYYDNDQMKDEILYENENFNSKEKEIDLPKQNEAKNEYSKKVAPKETILSNKEKKEKKFYSKLLNTDWSLIPVQDDEEFFEKNNWSVNGYQNINNISKRHEIEDPRKKENKEEDIEKKYVNLEIPPFVLKEKYIKDIKRFEKNKTNLKSTIYIKNISEKCELGILRKTFSTFGSIERIILAFDKRLKEKLKFASIRFEEKTDLNQIVSSMNNYYFYEKNIIVKIDRYEDHLQYEENKIGLSNIIYENEFTKYKNEIKKESKEITPNQNEIKKVLKVFEISKEKTYNIPIENIIRTKALDILDKKSRQVCMLFKTGIL
jgi:RNA recognition motif-containing protein